MRVSDFLPPLGWIASLASAVATAVWLQDATPIQTLPRGNPEPQVSSEARGANTLQLPPLTDAAAAAALFSMRPLLAEGRRPFNPEQIAAAPEVEPEPDLPEALPQAEIPVAPDPPEIVMLGSVEAGAQRRVLFRDLSNGTETWHGTGERVAGWTVVEILPDQVQLQLQDAKITFKLFGE